VSRALDSQLDYQHNNQDYMLGTYHAPDEPVDRDRDTQTGPSFLSDAVTGILFFIIFYYFYYFFIIFFII
jgi:hypothetical protein